MNILILTAFTKNVVWNNYGNCDFGKFAAKINLEYATNNNYNFLCEILQDALTDRHNTWNKITLIKKHLKFYDYVVWIDADAIFLNNIKIEDLIGVDIDLVITKNPPTESGIMYTMTSTGFMIWKNSDWSFKTLDNLWNNFSHYFYNGFHEQSALDEYLIPIIKNKNLLEKHSDDLECIINQENIKILPYKYHNMSNTFFVYHAGGDTPTKLMRIHNAYQKYITLKF